MTRRITKPTDYQAAFAVLSPDGKTVSVHLIGRDGLTVLDVPVVKREKEETSDENTGTRGLCAGDQIQRR